MPAQFSLPPDTRAVGTGNPPLDMDGVVDALTAAGVPNNVLNAAYAGGADPTGVANSAPAFQAAINALPAGGGAIYVPPGTYTLATALTPVSGMRLYGSSYQAATLQSSVSSLFTMDIGSQLDVVEIDHLSLIVTGAFPIFSKMWITRSSVHHCYLQAHNAGAAIWYSNSGTGYMAECRFYENREQVWGATRTVPAWYLNASNTGTLFQVNDNHWRDNVCFDNDHDAAQYWYQIVYSGAFAGVTNNANVFTDIVWEFPCGGMVWLDSCTYTTLERLTNEDLAALTVGSPLIKVTKNANGGASQNTTIRDYSRRGGSAAITDIQLASTCIGTEIDSPVAQGGSVLTIDLGSATFTTLTAMPPAANVSYLNTGTYQAVLSGGLQVKEGSNAKQGTAVLVAGSSVVANTSVTASSRIFLTSNADGGTPGWLRVSARTAGTSFTITSSSATDTSTVAWEIFEPSP